MARAGARLKASATSRKSCLGGVENADRGRGIACSAGKHVRAERFSVLHQTRNAHVRAFIPHVQMHTAETTLTWTPFI